MEHVTKCCVALHNYLMAGRLTDEGNAYCPNNFVDQEVRSKRKKLRMRISLLPIHKVDSNNYSKDAKIVRDSFFEYFNSNGGQVPWQHKMVSVENF